MPRGGARPGAGRKPKTAKALPRPEVKVPAAPVVTESEVLAAHDLTPLAYLLQVVNDTKAERRERLQAASIAAPYVHPRKGEGGKKDAAADAAKKVGAGRFAAAAPPKLVAAGGRKV